MVYLIGVLLKGDGSVFKSTSRKRLKSGDVAVYLSYAIQLQVKSLDFALLFNSKCSEALGRPRVRIRGRDKKGMVFVTYHDKDFGKWWTSQTLVTLKPLIETFPHEYLAGRFDSEANVNAGAVTVYGAEDHRDVMEHDRALSAKLGMRVGALKVHCKKGLRSYIEGRLIVTTMDKLRFGVNAKDFLRVIGGLSVKERDSRLRAMVGDRAWTPWTKAIRDRALELFQSGLNPKQISESLGIEFRRKVPAITIYFWVRRGTRSWSDFKQPKEI